MIGQYIEVSLGAGLAVGLLCVGIITVLRWIFPSFNSKYFKWTCWIQTHITFTFSNLRRSLLQLAGTSREFYGSDLEVSPQWLHKVLQQRMNAKLPPLLGVEITKDKLTGGMVGKMLRLSLRWQEGSSQELPTTLIVKIVSPTFEGHYASIMLGSYREAIFYDQFSSLSILPRSYYAHGSAITGEYIIIMEDLAPRTTLVGHILGNQCWGAVKVPDTIESPLKVLETIFLETADFHAKFWRDRSLLKLKWLKAVDWIQGNNRAKWELGVKIMQQKWQIIMENVKAGKTSIKYSQKVTEAMNTAKVNTSWQTFLSEFNISQPTTPFTICHGDFHPSNLLWEGGKRPVYMVDWAEVGVFCPFTDIAQFLISHATVEFRRQHELHLLRVYYNRLVENGVSPTTFPFDECFERYKRGGIERWLQMLILLAYINVKTPNALPDFGVTFFHDQVNAFVEDHADSCKKPIAFMSGYCLPSFIK